MRPRLFESCHAQQAQSLGHFGNRQSDPRARGWRKRSQVACVMLPRRRSRNGGGEDISVAVSVTSSHQDSGAGHHAFCFQSMPSAHSQVCTSSGTTSLTCTTCMGDVSTQSLLHQSCPFARGVSASLWSRGCREANPPGLNGQQRLGGKIVDCVV